MDRGASVGVVVDGFADVGVVALRVLDVVELEGDRATVDDEVRPTVLSVTGSLVDVVVRSEVVGVVMLGPMPAGGAEAGRTRM